MANQIHLKRLLRNLINYFQQRKATFVYNEHAQSEVKQISVRSTTASFFVFASG